MRWRYLIVVASVLVVLPAVTIAQVVQNNIGQALDANYQIGSGGYNTVNGGMGGVNSQLYINAQVSGLAAFRGPVPIEATNQLRMVVPSAALGDFVRQSVGASQTLTRSTYMTTPYYNSGRTVFGVPGIVSGMATPGGNASISQISPLAVQRAYSAVTQAYSPIVIPGAAPVISGIELPGTPASVSIVSRPGAMALFGVPQYAEGTALALEVRKYLQAGGVGSQPGGGEEANPNQTVQGLQVGGQETLGGPNANELAASTRGGRVGQAPQTNQDAYLDLLMMLENQIEDQRLNNAPPVKPGEQPEKTPQSGFPKPGENKEPGDSTPGTPGAATPGQVTPGTGANYLPNLGGPTKLVERNKAGIVIHGLAGASPDLFNSYMIRAQNLMREGKYYEASRQYELASIMNRTNPMAHLGACLGIFTAGEPFSAAIHLREAMSLLPPLMETRLDVGSMVKPEDFRAQLRALDERIAGEPGKVDPLLLYVATYMHNDVGETEQAKTTARMLHNSDTKDKLFQVYATYVLTNKKPAAQPPAGKSPTKD